jgi:hypothetical protein
MVVVGGEGPCTGNRAHVGGGSSRERSPCDCHGGWGQWLNAGPLAKPYILPSEVGVGTLRPCPFRSGKEDGRVCTLLPDTGTVTRLRIVCCTTVLRSHSVASVAQVPPCHLDDPSSHLPCSFCCCSRC